MKSDKAWSGIAILLAIILLFWILHALEFESLKPEVQERIRHSDTIVDIE